MFVEALVLIGESILVGAGSAIIPYSVSKSSANMAAEEIKKLPKDQVSEENIMKIIKKYNVSAKVVSGLLCGGLAAGSIIAATNILDSISAEAETDTNSEMFLY